MDVQELFTIFRNHRHSGTFPDANKIPQLNGTTIIVDGTNSFIIIASPDGTKFRIGVDNDGALKTDRI